MIAAMQHERLDSSQRECSAPASLMPPLQHFRHLGSVRLTRDAVTAACLHVIICTECHLLRNERVQLRNAEKRMNVQA